MAESSITIQNFRIFRALLVVAGGLLIAMALVADRLGFGVPGSFGIGQFLLVLFGSLVLLAGLLGKAIKNFHQGMAIVVLDTLLLLGLLEVGAIVIARLGLVPSYSDVTMTRYLEVPYYHEQEWTAAFWGEAKSAEAYRYAPYVIWRHQPFEGVHVNVNDEGIRITPGSDCTTNAFKVFTFGGSSMWGWGSPDWGTIASYLQLGLDEIMEDPVCVVNFGEDAFVSTQGLIMLKLQLQRGNIPDAVVFYDGVNDVYAAYESGQPGVHPMLDGIAARFEGQENGLARWFMGSRQFWLAKVLVQNLGSYDSPVNQNPGTYMGSGRKMDGLALSIVESYLNNYKIVNTLAHEFGFQSYFFWQPHLAVGNKVLVENEQAILSEMDDTLASLANQVYGQMEGLSADFENLWYLANVFDNQYDQIWIDAWGHKTPEGNKLVAWAMLDLMRTNLVMD